MLVCDIDTFGHPVVQAIVNGKFSRAVNRNQSRLTRHISTRMRLVPSFTPGGVFAGYVYGALLPKDDVAHILGMIVRGLHQYYLHRPLVDDAEFTVHRIKDIGTVLPIVRVAASAGLLNYVPIGDSTVFNCIYGIEAVDPALTMWFLAFYCSPTSQGAIFRITTRASKKKGAVA